MAIAVNQDETWLAVGETTALGPTALLFIKGDKSGNILWQKAFIAEEPGVSLEALAVATVDEGNTLVLSRYITKSKHSALLLKIDQEGKLIWQKMISTEKDIYLRDMVRVPDEKMFLVGQALGQASSVTLASCSHLSDFRWKSNMAENLSWPGRRVHYQGCASRRWERVSYRESIH